MAWALLSQGDMKRTTQNLHRFLLSLAAAGTLLAAPSAQAQSIPTPGVAFLAPELDGTLNVNTATEEEWDLLPGVGPSTAAKLVAYRKRHPFKDVLHVMRIKGIGRKTFAKMKPYLSLTGPTTLHVVGAGKPSSAKKIAPLNDPNH